MRHIIVLTLLITPLAAAAQLAAAPPASGALQASNLLNPNVSVIGWLQGEAGRRHTDPGITAPAAMQLKEAEVGFQAVVDPYARADFFISFGEGKVDLEEGYISWFTLPRDLALKAGKFRADLGRFNRTHPPETAFADRPLVHERFLGDEGLSGTGAALSWQVPNPWSLVTWDVNVITPPAAADSPAFDTGRRRDLLYVTRLNGYYDLSEMVNVTAGGSYAYGPAGQEFNTVTSSSKTLTSQVGGLDLTFRWKNPRRAVYRSAFWQTEVLWDRRDAAADSAVGSWGMFSHLEYQFAQRWRSGVRGDYTLLPADGSKHEAGALAYLTFTPSEFSAISLQGRQARKSDGVKETLGFLKVTLNIGPHGAHPF